MLIVMHPTYTLRVTIKDRARDQTSFGAIGSLTGAQSPPVPVSPYKFFGGLNTNRTGCDDVLVAVRDALGKAGIDAEVSLDKFEHRG